MTTRAVAVACLLLLAGCRPAHVNPPHCEAAERPSVQEGSHLLGDEQPPVPYSSTPPTSGWHTSGRPPDPGTYTEQLSDPAIVSVLEQGGVVLAHDPDLPLNMVDDLQRLPTTVVDLVVTPYADAPAPVTLTAWGVLQRCTDVAADEVRAWVDANAGGPEH